MQYVAIRYTERLAEAGSVRSVGTKGDSYDNALAESLNGLYKAELIHKEGPWYGLEDVEHATMDYVHWFNHERLHGEIGMIPPVEMETMYWVQLDAATTSTPQTEATPQRQAATTRSADRNETLTTDMTLAETTAQDPGELLPTLSSSSAGG